jgi:hypothetical protein
VCDLGGFAEGERTLFRRVRADAANFGELVSVRGDFVCDVGGFADG